MIVDKYAIVLSFLLLDIVYQTFVGKKEFFLSGFFNFRAMFVEIHHVIILSSEKNCQFMMNFKEDDYEYQGYGSDCRKKKQQQ